MRCPMCKARVRDQDDLQIHYMESCDAIGDQQDEDLGDEATSKEPIEEMVEVSFKWMNTKGTVERSICLISSLAGQIKLKPMLKDDAYKSGKIVVPCGLHCCQLVVGEECYPVIDLDIDSSCDVVYIVLQEDLDTEERTVESMPSVPNAGFMSSESTPPGYPIHPRPFMDKGRPLLQDEIDADYARHILREIEREEQETATADEAISMQSHGSSCAARQGMRSDRPGSASAVEHHDEELTYMARNGMHAAQVHIGRGNGERSEAGRVEAPRAEAGMVEVEKDEREKEHQRHSYHRQNGNGEALQRGTGTRKSRKRMLQKVADSAPYRPSGSESETILDPPQGFKSKITSEEKSSTTGQRRGSEEKTRANGHGGDSEDGRRDSKSSVDSLRNLTALEERAADRRQPSGSEHEKAREVPEEKPKYSWGYDEEQRDLKLVRDAMAKSDVHYDVIDGQESERSRRDDKRTGSDTERIVKVRALDYQKAKSVPYGGPTEGEQISELIAKCRSYEHTLEKVNEESNHLKEQVADLQEKSRKDTEELLSKEDKIDELQARCNSYETEMERFMAENNDLMNQLSKIQEENAEKDRNDLDRLKERLEDVLRENRDLKEENESLQTAHNLQQEDMDRINKGMQDEVEALKGKLNNVKVGNRSFQYSELHKVNALKEEVTELTAENRKLRSKLSNIQRELSITQTETSDNDKDHVTSPREYEAHDQIEAYDHEPYRATTDTYSRSRDRISAHDHDQVLDKAYSDIHVSSSREPLFRTATAVRDSETYDNRRQTSSGRSHRSYDTSAISSKYDTNHNYLLSSDLSTTRFRTLQTRKSDGGGPLRTTTTNPIRASHFDYLAGYEQEATSRHGVENSDHVDSTGAERVVRRERKPRRERPHSFHGRSSDASHNDPYSANESDSREISRRLSPLQHEDPGSYNYRLTNRTDDYRNDYLNSHDYTSTAADLSPRSLKPFAPTSIDEIKTGMRVLVTRSSGRIGKGTVKWKGKLDGHADHFIGIELETPNGKHDGVFERYRYFRCKKDHGIFAKFSKVVMVWGSI